MNHLIHALVTVMTVGLWVFGWFFAIVLHGMKHSYCMACGTPYSKPIKKPTVDGNRETSEKLALQSKAGD